MPLELSSPVPNDFRAQTLALFTAEERTAIAVAVREANELGRAATAAALSANRARDKLFDLLMPKATALLAAPPGSDLNTLLAWIEAQT